MKIKTGGGNQTLPVQFGFKDLETSQCGYQDYFEPDSVAPASLSPVLFSDAG